MSLDFAFSGNSYKQFAKKGHRNLPGLMNQDLRPTLIGPMRGQRGGASLMGSDMVKESNKRI